MEITYRGVSLSDLDTLAQLEASSYPSDEAASADALAFRIENANPYFLVMIYFIFILLSSGIRIQRNVQVFNALK